eukprot:COSAG06_NODE_4994_length_3802_cov_5.156360_2_plen_162_part_00
MARYVTMLLYLSDVDAGGETLLPLADEGLRHHGCEGCDKKAGASIDWREDACLGCIKPQAERLLSNCASPTNSGVTSLPQRGRLLLFYNYAGACYCMPQPSLPGDSPSQPDFASSRSSLSNNLLPPSLAALHCLCCSGRRLRSELAPCRLQSARGREIGRT